VENCIIVTRFIQHMFYRPYHIIAIELKVNWRLALTDQLQQVPQKCKLQL